MIDIEYYRTVIETQTDSRILLSEFKDALDEIEAEKRVNIFSVGAGMFLIGLLLGFIISIFTY